MRERRQTFGRPGHHAGGSPQCGPRKPRARLRALAGALLFLTAASMPAPTSADASAEVHAFMEDYVSVFDTGYARQVVARFHAPLYMLAPNGDVRSFETSKDIRLTVKKWKQYMIRAGFGHTELKVLNVRALSDSTALASTAFDRFSTSGEVYQQGGATYTLVKKDDGWKIFMIHIHDPGQVLGFD